MEVSDGWKPLDILVGGMLTAGVAFGVYKFGRLGRKAGEMGAVMVTELDASRLQSCIALAGRPSELELVVLPQPDLRCRQLAASLRQSMQEEEARASQRSCSSSNISNFSSSSSSSNSSSSSCRTEVARVRDAAERRSADDATAASTGSDNDLAVAPAAASPRDGSPRQEFSKAAEDGPRGSTAGDPILKGIFMQLCAEGKRELQDLFDIDKVPAVSRPPISSSPPPKNLQSPPQGGRHCYRTDHRPYRNPLMAVDSGQTPPQLKRQLQSYRDMLDKWITDSEAKAERIEEQRMSLATDLCVTREALQTERRHRADAELMRQRAEVQLKDVENRLQSRLETKDKMSQREEEVRRLQKQVLEMEEQLELLYVHNVVTPRSAMHHNVRQHQQLSVSLEEATSKLNSQQYRLEEMDNEITNLSTQVNKMRRDTRQLSQENTMLQKQMHASQQVARQLVALVFERSAGKESDLTQLMELLNAPDSDLPLDKLLESVIHLLMAS